MRKNLFDTEYYQKFTEELKFVRSRFYEIHEIFLKDDIELFKYITDPPEVVNVLTLELSLDGINRYGCLATNVYYYYDGDGFFERVKDLLTKMELNFTIYLSEPMIAVLYRDIVSRIGNAIRLFQIAESIFKKNFIFTIPSRYLPVLKTRFLKSLREALKEFQYILEHIYPVKTSESMLSVVEAEVHPMLRYLTLSRLEYFHTNGLDLHMTAILTSFTVESNDIGEFSKPLLLLTKKFFGNREYPWNDKNFVSELFRSAFCKLESLTVFIRLFDRVAAGYTSKTGFNNPEKEMILGITAGMQGILKNYFDSAITRKFFEEPTTGTFAAYRKIFLQPIEKEQLDSNSVIKLAALKLVQIHFIIYIIEEILHASPMTREVSLSDDNTKFRLQTLLDSAINDPKALKAFESSLVFYTELLRKVLSMPTTLTINK